MGTFGGGSGKRLEDDVQAVVIEPAALDTTILVKGVMFTAELNDTTDHEMQLTEERWLQGVILEVDNHTPGDYAELRIMMPNPPDPDVEVNQFAETIFIKPSKQTVMILETSTQLPAGLKLKLSYTSVATSGPQPVVYADYVTWRK
jgi:hypothetical protein